MPIQPLAKALSERGVDLLVDGAHAPGMLPLDLRAIGAAYYTGNCHKWIWRPKSAGFLFVRPIARRQFDRCNQPRSQFTANRSLKIPHRIRLDRHLGSHAALATPEALRFMGTLLPGDWPAVMARNRSLALAGRDAICRRLGSNRRVQTR